MVIVRYGDKNSVPYELNISQDQIVVRTLSRNPLSGDRPFEVAAVSPQTRSVLQSFEVTTQFREAGVEVLKPKEAAMGSTQRDQAKTILNAESDVQFAGRALVDPHSGKPVIYTENLFAKFDDDETPESCQALLSRYGLSVKQVVTYARNAYFVAAPANTGLVVFDLAERLLNETGVELCHPELVRQMRQRQVFPQQWHLKSTMIGNQMIAQSANVEAAWRLSTGTGTIIAVIDDGVDLDHEELRSKIVAPRDVTRKTNDPRPGNRNNHGTACAGVALANGNFGASGVAPEARLMPIRLASGLGSQNEADAFVWAAQNGADVISCSWGPEDGEWWNASDPLHQQVVPLPASTRLAINYVLTQGRNGKGCVVCFAAGNGNENVANDGYASNPQVIAVAASNDQGTRAAYSDMGDAVWCAFPSNNGEPSLTPGIWTTDRTGPVGYNPGRPSLGDINGNYTNSFGGTSSACPGVAGVAALIIARNPDLRWDEVREVLKQSCDRIDPTGGQYNADGRSPLYGYGRVNAEKAVELARPAQPTPVQIFKAVQDIPIVDLQTSVLAVTVPNNGVIQSIKVVVDIDHTYIGDLIVTLKPPAAMSASPVILHQRSGGGTDNIKTTYDQVSTPALLAYQGKNPEGTWQLSVEDQAAVDVGNIRSVALEISF
jgi:subtilisin family serine protease